MATQTKRATIYQYLTWSTRPSKRPLPKMQRTSQRLAKGLVNLLSAMMKWSRGLKKMAAYNLFFKKSVQKDFDAIPKKDLTKILNRIEALAENPRPPGCEKLTGQDRYRLRQGRYRILYSVQDDELTVWIVKVAHRKHIYR